MTYAPTRLAGSKPITDRLPRTPLDSYYTAAPAQVRQPQAPTPFAATQARFAVPNITGQYEQQPQGTGGGGVGTGAGPYGAYQPRQATPAPWMTGAIPDNFFGRNNRVAMSGGRLAMTPQGNVTGNYSMFPGVGGIDAQFKTDYAFTSPTSTTNNQAAIDAQAGEYLRLHSLQYQDPWCLEREYGGLLPILPDGKIAQVRWKVGLGLPTTRASKNFEFDVHHVHEAERRRRETVAQLSEGFR